MTRIIKQIILILIIAGTVYAELTTYPAPDGARLSDYYAVWVDGEPLDLYMMNTERRDGKYYFCYFDFSGSVTVKVVSQQSLDNTVIRPVSYGIEYQLAGDTLEFQLDQPRKISIEPDGPNSVLILLSNPLETDIPDPNNENVVYYGPGVHDAGRIDIGSNQTLYIAGGAIVNGGVETSGENITIRGRGMIFGGNYAKNDGPIGHMVAIRDSRNVRVRDIILCDAWGWTLIPWGSDSITIENVKIVNSRFYNEDGINPVNSRDVYIRDCFIRTQDDCIAVKGFDRSLSCERIRIEDCVLWTDGANAFRIGFECEVSGIMSSDLTAVNLDILHLEEGQRPETDYWANCVWYIQPCDNTPMGGMHFENIRINIDDGRYNLIKMMPMIRSGWGWEGTEVGQYVRDVTFKDISVTGADGPDAGIIYIAGVDAEHYVQNITLDNVWRDGECVGESSSGVIIGDFAADLSFFCGPALINYPSASNTLRGSGPRIYDIMGRGLVNGAYLSIIYPGQKGPARIVLPNFQPL
jgi:hypothetical protein